MIPGDVKEYGQEGRRVTFKRTFEAFEGAPYRGPKTLFNLY
jgi:hypothetical protein